jgi:hypothetical protein
VGPEPRLKYSISDSQITDLGRGEGRGKTSRSGTRNFLQLSAPTVIYGFSAHSPRYCSYNFKLNRSINFKNRKVLLSQIELANTSIAAMCLSQLQDKHHVLFIVTFIYFRVNGLRFKIAAAVRQVNNLCH